MPHLYEVVGRRVQPRLEASPRQRAHAGRNVIRHDGQELVSVGLGGLPQFALRGGLGRGLQALGPGIVLRMHASEVPGQDRFEVTDLALLPCCPLRRSSHRLLTPLWVDVEVFEPPPQRCADSTGVDTEAFR